MPLRRALSGEEIPQNEPLLIGEQPAGFGEMLISGFQQESWAWNTVGQMLRPEYELDQAFEPREHIKPEFLGREKHFYRAANMAEFEYIEKELRRETRNRQLLEAGGWNGIAAMAAGGLLDPLIALQLALPGLGWWGLATQMRAGLAARVGITMAVGAGEMSLMELSLQATQMSRTDEESRTNIMAAAIFAGFLPAGAAKGIGRRMLRGGWTVPKPWRGVAPDPDAGAKLADQLDEVGELVRDELHMPKRGEPDPFLESQVVQSPIEVKADTGFDPLDPDGVERAAREASPEYQELRAGLKNRAETDLAVQSDEVVVPDDLGMEEGWNVALERGLLEASTEDETLASRAAAPIYDRTAGRMDRITGVQEDVADTGILHAEKWFSKLSPQMDVAVNSMFITSKRLVQLLGRVPVIMAKNLQGVRTPINVEELIDAHSMLRQRVKNATETYYLNYRRRMHGADPQAFREVEDLGWWRMARRRMELVWLRAQSGINVMGRQMDEPGMMKNLLKTPSGELDQVEFEELVYEIALQKKLDDNFLKGKPQEAVELATYVRENYFEKVKKMGIDLGFWDELEFKDSVYNYMPVQFNQQAIVENGRVFENLLTEQIEGSSLRILSDMEELVPDPMFPGRMVPVPTGAGLGRAVGHVVNPPRYKDLGRPSGREIEIPETVGLGRNVGRPMEAPAIPQPTVEELAARGMPAAREIPAAPGGTAPGRGPQPIPAPPGGQAAGRAGPALAGTEHIEMARKVREGQKFEMERLQTQKIAENTARDLDEAVVYFSDGTIARLGDIEEVVRRRNVTAEALSGVRPAGRGAESAAPPARGEAPEAPVIKPGPQFQPPGPPKIVRHGTHGAKTWNYAPEVPGLERTFPEGIAPRTQRVREFVEPPEAPKVRRFDPKRDVGEEFEPGQAGGPVSIAPVRDIQTTQPGSGSYRASEPQARELAREIIDRIKRSSLGRDEAHLLHKELKGRGMERILQIDQMSDNWKPFLHRDISTLVDIYHHSVLPDFAMIERFGTHEIEPFLAKIRQEANWKGYHAETVYPRKSGEGLEEYGKRIARIRRRLHDRSEKDLKKVTAMWQILRNSYGPSYDPGSWHRTSRTLRNLSVMTHGGMFVLSAIVDVARVPMTMGFSRAFGDGLRVMIGNRDRFKMLARDASYGRFGSEYLDAGRARALMGLGETFQNTGLLGRLIAGGAENMYHWNMLTAWNHHLKQWASISGSLKALDLMDGINAGKAISKADRTWLAQIGIDDRLAREMNEQWILAGEHVTPDGMKLAMTAKWDNQALAKRFELAMQRIADDTIVTPGRLERPLWSNTWYGAMALQYKSFAFSATNRIMVSGLQRRDAMTASTFAAAVGMGMLGYHLKNVSAGRESSDNPMEWVYQGMELSGVFGIMGNIAEGIEMLPGGGFSVREMMGADPVPAWQRQAKLGDIMGPSADFVHDSVQVGVDILQGDVNQQTKSAFNRIRPYRGLFYMSYLMNAVGQDKDTLF